MAVRALMGALLLQQSVAIQMHEHEDHHKSGAHRPTCKQACLPNCPASSRTGVPCMPVADTWPYKSNESWRVELGERILMAAHPNQEATESACGGFKLFGDSAWCLAAFKGDYGKLGLSFGIEERDLWSETMSNDFHMPTKLYDCFQNPKSSPALAMIAPNAKGSCAGNPHHCYETHYDAFRVCLGPKHETVNQRQYTSLSELLAGRGEMSTHLKIDVEGSEWSVLEDLLKNEEDMKKIRTLDMEVHFGFGAASEAAHNKGSKKDQLQREVGIFEQLASRFAVTGTNIETNADGWQPVQSCPKQQCEEPFVHTSGGVPVNQFAISFVNHAQLRRGIPSPDAISAAHHSLAADHAEDHMEDRAEADAEDHVQDHAEADAEDHMQDHAEGDAEDHMQDHAEADAKDHMQDHTEADAEDHMEDHAEADAEEHSGDHADDEEDTA
mmetsp:Transcript_15216/g.31662  ORF Transcript_15216/g.31662 Transcript_15216/m.31662 type:complete len:441 (+) Transcript_15216:46-1368(+)